MNRIFTYQGHDVQRKFMKTSTDPVLVISGSGVRLMDQYT